MGFSSPGGVPKCVVTISCSLTTHIPSTFWSFQTPPSTARSSYYFRGPNFWCYLESIKFTWIFVTDLSPHNLAWPPTLPAPIVDTTFPFTSVDGVTAPQAQSTLDPTLPDTSACPPPWWTRAHMRARHCIAAHNGRMPQKGLQSTWGMIPRLRPRARRAPRGADSHPHVLSIPECLFTFCLSSKDNPDRTSHCHGDMPQQESPLQTPMSRSMCFSRAFGGDVPQKCAQTISEFLPWADVALLFLHALPVEWAKPCPPVCPKDPAPPASLSSTLPL